MARQKPQFQIGNYITDIENDLIAQGRRGQIRKCRRKDNKDQFYCLKVIKKLGNNQNQRYEMDAYKRLKEDKEKHYNTLRVYEIIEDNENFYIITELCDSTFEEYLNQRWKNMLLTQDEIADFLGQIVRGYIYLRRLKINVRDFTPKTIFVQRLINGRIILKLSDYCINDGKIDYGARAPYYQPPEIFNPNSMKIKQSDFCDIYALGLILYTMCFKGNNIVNVEDFSSLQTFHSELQDNIAFKCPNTSFCSVELLSLISQMIVYNPEDRIKWETLDQRQKLPYFLILKDIYFVNLKLPIGSGAQGTTYITQDLRNNEELVCKKIPNQKEGTSREIQIFEQIKGKINENVIKIVDIIIHTQETYLIMEKCDQSLQSYLEKKGDQNQQLTSKEIVEILYQIVQGYYFLKQLGIIHRDLKPDNILLKKNEQGKNILKIIDFGVGKIIGKEVTSTEAGTPLFAAPEVLQSGVKYSYQCDIFSLGVILHYLAFLKMFKNICSRAELLNFHNSLQNKPFDCPQHNNPLITQLINNMIVYDPNKRISWEQLLAHKIFDEMRIPQNNKQPQQTQQVLQNSQQITTGTFTEIYKYIFALYNLASKLLVQLEDYEKDNRMRQDEILIMKQFIIRFQLSCWMCINQLDKNGFITLDGKDYRAKSLKDFQDWLAQINLQQLYKQSLEKMNSLKDVQLNNNSQIIAQGFEMLNEQKNSLQNVNITFLHTHCYFYQFFWLVKNSFLSSNIPNKLKYFLLKFQNVFQEYPIQNFEFFTETKLTIKIYEPTTVENYIEDQLKQYK